MHGFEWKDQRGIEGTGFVRALRSLLTSHLPSILPNLDSAIADQFEREITNYKVVNGQSCLGLYERVLLGVTLLQATANVQSLPWRKNW